MVGNFSMLVTFLHQGGVRPKLIFFRRRCMEVLDRELDARIAVPAYYFT